MIRQILILRCLLDKLELIINTLRSGQNVRYSANDIFKYNFLYDICCLIQISVTQGSIEQLAITGPDDGLVPSRYKPLSEPMMS